MAVSILLIIWNVETLVNTGKTYQAPVIVSFIETNAMFTSLIAGGGTGHHQLFLVKFGVLEPAKSKWFRPKPEASCQSSIGKGFGHQTVKDLGLFGPFFVDDLPQRIIRLIKGPGSGP